MSPTRSPGDESGRTIRRAIAEDWPRLRTIQAASLPSPWPDLLELAVEGASGSARSPSEPGLTTDRGPLALVVVVEDRRVGYAVVLGSDGEADRAAGVTLVELAVAPGHRGRGHGSALLGRVLALAAGRTVWLTVRANDERARRFYADHGFQVHERLPEHYAGAAGIVLCNET